MKMRTLVTLAIGLALLLAFSLGLSVRPSGIYEPPIRPDNVVVTLPAPIPEPEGVPDLPYWNYLIPTGPICVEVRGSVYATQAALDIYGNTDAKMLPARSNCLGYPRTNVVKLVPRDLGTGACAMTGGTTMHKQNVRGIEIYVLDDPTVWYNSNPALLMSCFGSAFKARHVYGHEFLHALGMKHNCLPSLVSAKCETSDYSWQYDRTTLWDQGEINRRY